MAVTRLTCRSCEARLKVSAEAGTAVKCPRCGKPIRVPEPEPEDDFEVVDEEEEEPAPKKRREAITSKAAKAPAAKAKRPRDEDEPEDFDEVDEVEDEPAPKKGRNGITSKAAKANSAALGTGRRSRAAEDDPDEEEDEQPRKRGKGRQKEKAGSPLLWIGLGGGGLLVVAGVVVVVLLLLPGKDKGKEPSKGPVTLTPAPPQPKGFQSPQEVWDAFIAANKRKDAKSLVDCLAPESRRPAAADMAYGAAVFRSVAGADPTGQLANARKPSFAALDKHGLTAEATKDVMPVLKFDGKNPPNANDVLQRRNAFVAMIKDHDGLLIDLFAAGFQETNAGIPDVLAGATLKNVKIEGNTATGTVVSQTQNLQQETPIQFTKGDEGWKIVPTAGRK